jgi:arsenate reductase
MNDQTALETFASLAQPTRLTAVRRLLAAYPGSLAAGELARVCEAPHNTMSSHLGVLTRAGLVQVERVGRSMNYRADPRALRQVMTFLAKDCCNGRPDLCGDFAKVTAERNEAADVGGVMPAFNVLFLCTRNSARSIIAEAVLRKISGNRFNAYSAGSQPARHPLPEVLGQLRLLGYDAASLRCKSWDEFSGHSAPRLDFVIALCDTPRGQVCPDFGDKQMTAAWPLPDPAAFRGSPAERAVLLGELIGMVRRRLEIFTSLPFTSLDRMALKKRLDEIGDTVRTAP